MNLKVDQFQKLSEISLNGTRQKSWLYAAMLKERHWKELWGEVSMCDTPPILGVVHVDLVQYFIEGTVLQLTTGHW
jgi:hypothetical protein